MQGAMGPVVRLRTRSLYDCLLARAGWDAPVIVNSKAVDEIIFWKENPTTDAKHLAQIIALFLLILSKITSKVFINFVILLSVTYTTPCAMFHSKPNQVTL
jgi:hypothetical protein